MEYEETHNLGNEFAPRVSAELGASAAWMLILGAAAWMGALTMATGWMSLVLMALAFGAMASAAVLVRAALRGWQREEVTPADLELSPQPVRARY